MHKQLALSSTLVYSSTSANASPCNSHRLIQELNKQPYLIYINLPGLPRMGQGGGVSQNQSERKRILFDYEVEHPQFIPTEIMVSVTTVLLFPNHTEFCSSLID